MAQVERRRARLGGCATRVVVGLMVAVAMLAVAGFVYQRTAAEADRANYPPMGELVSVGDYALHLYCTGEGGPTVVLIAGAGNIYAHWDSVQREVSDFTRVCSYDRAGTGWSDYPESRPTMETHIEDLHRLLEAAGEPEPYILVGHSMGGIAARRYYAQYPDEVAGMVLVDSSVEGMYQYLPSIVQESNAAGNTIWGLCQAAAPFGVMRVLGLGDAYASAFPNYSEAARNAIRASFYRTETCRGMSWEYGLTSLLETGAPSSLGDLPLIVLTAGLNEVEANPNQRYSEAQAEQFRQVEAAMLELHEGLAVLSTNSRHIIAEESGHFIQASQPELVVEAIREVIEMAAETA